ncbi:hypothetical protein HN51_031264 [Arachis hypogaea]
MEVEVKFRLPTPTRTKKSLPCSHPSMPQPTASITSSLTVPTWISYQSVQCSVRISALVH